MMARALPRRRAAALLLALPAGCSATPDPVLYVLAPKPGVVLQPRAGLSVELRRIGLAGYLDRPGIVRAATEYRLTVTDMSRWGEPLGRMLERVITESLVMRLPGAAVFSESGGITTQAAVILEIDVQRLDVAANGEVVLLAQVAARRDGVRGPGVARTVRRTATPAGTATEDVVAAMSLAVGELADEIARLLVG